MTVRQRDAYEAAKLSHEKVMQRLRLNQAQAVAKSEADFNNAWELVCQGEEGIVSQVNEYLELREVDRIRKAGALCRSWNKEIFNKIQSQIDKEVDRRDRDGEIQKRWRQAQDEYMTALEGKDKGLFRDIIIEDDYDPLCLCARHVKYESKTLKDPLKLSLAIKNQEDELIDQSHSKQAPAQHDGRLPVTQWSHLESTPYGHYNRMEGNTNHKSAALAAYRLGSQVSMDHYTYARGADLVNREFPKPKRTFNCRR